MKIIALFLLAVSAALAGLKAGTAPVFDIPRVDGIAIDGKGIDWGNRGLRIETLAGNSGQVYLPQDLDAGFRIGWDDKGLVVLVTVHDGQTREAKTPDQLSQCDSVEMYLSPQPGSPEYFQFVTGPSSDPKFPGLRSNIKNRRATPAPPTTEVESATARTPDGYIVEARLPWSSIGIKPAPGTEMAFQLCVNDTDPGSRVKVTWFPSDRTATEAKDMYLLRLTNTPGRTIRMACVTSVDLGRPRLDIIAPPSLIGREVTARAGSKTVATCIFQPIAGRARATVMVPPGDIEISCSNEESLMVDGRWFNAWTGVAIANSRVVFKPGVFSGEEFPPCDFESPSEAQSGLGKCRFLVTYYDADYNEVTKATRPGRYGAIVQVKAETGQTFKRYVTLFRTPPDFNWKLAGISASSIQFPKELQLDPKVVNEQADNIASYLRDQLFYPDLNRGQSQAILLAGLSELKATGQKATARTSPKAVDQKWWFGLKKKTGNLRMDYYVHLPATYEANSGKKWPLILFLHGSGQRGDKIGDVTVTGLPQYVDKRPDFPFIVIAPQCGYTEDWSPPELNYLLDRVEAKYRVDLDRVYLTGLSMGGFGAWALAIDSPERFAAVAPMCGGGDPADVERIKNIPFWVFHGANDPIVPPEHSKRMVAALNAIGGNAKLTIFPNTDHGCWNKAYPMPELYEWLLQQHRSSKSN